MVTATWNGAVLAESQDTVMVEGYAKPTEAAASIAGYVAFWHGVKVGADGTGSRTLMDRLMGRAQ